MASAAEEARRLDLDPPERGVGGVVDVGLITVDERQRGTHGAETLERRVVQRLPEPLLVELATFERARVVEDLLDVLASVLAERIHLETVDGHVDQRRDVLEQGEALLRRRRLDLDVRADAVDGEDQRGLEGVGRQRLVLGAIRENLTAHRGDDVVVVGDGHHEGTGVQRHELLLFGLDERGGDPGGDGGVGHGYCLSVNHFWVGMTHDSVATYVLARKAHVATLHTPAC